MARAYAEFEVRNDGGEALRGAVVSLFTRGAEVPASFFAADSGGLPLTQLVTDEHGRAAAYVDPARYVFDVWVAGVRLVARRPYDAGVSMLLLGA